MKWGKKETYVQAAIRLFLYNVAILKPPHFGAILPAVFINIKCSS
jgi:hypothetical protein